MWKEWEKKNCPESGGMKAARKTETAIEGLHYETWREWDKTGEQEQQVEGIGDC